MLCVLTISAAIFNLDFWTSIQISSAKLLPRNTTVFFFINFKLSNLERTHFVIQHTVCIGFDIHKKNRYRTNPPRTHFRKCRSCIKMISHNCSIHRRYFSFFCANLTETFCTLPIFLYHLISTILVTMLAEHELE